MKKTRSKKSRDTVPLKDSRRNRAMVFPFLWKTRKYISTVLCQELKKKTTKCLKNYLKK
jgi:hypothetical protein